jgi:predicted DNA binding CopG/RHH family protein
MKALQRFSDDYLQRCREMSKDDIAKFLDDFRRLHGGTKSGSRLISLKVPEDLLEAFKAKSSLQGTQYQTKIKELIRDWLRAG